MKQCKNKHDFFEFMKQHGYQVRWTGERKYITYTCQNGMKCRDIKLHEEKYRKEEMGLEFESLKQKNAANIQKMEKATILTIVDSEQWTALINTVKNLNEQMNMNRQEVMITATEQNLDETKTAVENQAANLKMVLDTTSKSLTESIADQTEAL